MSKTDAKDFSLKDHFYGAATVGERGQIVIPVEARKRYHIETGDKVLIMGAPHQRGLMVIKIDAMREFMTTILSDLQHMEQEIASGPDAAGQAKTEDEAL
jgi:AbrB family looped-hinge helix DNA binding protein